MVMGKKLGSLSLSLSLYFCQTHTHTHTHTPLSLPLKCIKYFLRLSNFVFTPSAKTQCDQIFLDYSVQLKASKQILETIICILKN